MGRVKRIIMHSKPAACSTRNLIGRSPFTKGNNLSKTQLKMTLKIMAVVEIKIERRPMESAGLLRI